MKYKFEFETKEKLDKCKYCRFNEVFYNPIKDNSQSYCFLSKAELDDNDLFVSNENTNCFLEEDTNEL